MPASLIGKTIDQYQIVEQIGQGGMATVFKAYQPSIERYVALKILPSQFAEDPNFVKRFEHEAKAIAALEHPHILPVYDFGAQDGLTYMVMRYVPSGTLTNLMGTPLSNQRIVRLVSDVARALDYAHQQGVVHRDVKPSNILIDKLGEVLLTDFGIAKMVEGTGATRLTSDGSILGTPAYMSPEQAKAGNVDGRSDIYSLGVVLYELLTGRPPYQAETPLAVVLMHLNEPLPLPRVVNPDIPEPLERVVLKAMAKNPEQRYQTAGELEQALQQALKEIESATAGMPMTTTQPHRLPGPVPQPAKPGKSLLPLLLGSGGVLALLCLIGGGVMIFRAFVTPTQTVTPTASASNIVSLGSDRTPSPAPVSPTSTPAQPSPTFNLNDRSLEPIPTVPGLDGQILFEDRFEANQHGWFTGENEDEHGQYQARMANGGYRLSQQAKKGTFAWEEPEEANFSDFVLSVEATPLEHNAAFAYGVTFRNNFDGDFYAFELDSEGAFVVNLYQGGEWETLVDYTELPAIRPDGPNQLVVKAIGPSLSFFVNGQAATTIADDTLDAGSIGVALELYNEGDNAAVEFDNLVVRQVSPAEQTAPTPTANPILLEETFDSDARGWATGEFEDEYSQDEITIEDGRYTLSVTTQPERGAYVEKLLPNQEFSDFTLTLEATPRDSEEHYTYGVAFREDKDGNVYTFQIGNDGLYAVLLYDDGWKRLKDWSSSQAIKVGQINRLIVVAKGPSLTFYVNDVQLTTLEDETLAKGRVGLIVDVSGGNHSATVDFDNLIIRR